MHVHTPESYEENFGDDWDEYVWQLKEKAEEHGISVMGVTDYFSVDGYEKLRNEYEPLGEPSLELDNGSNLFLMPNVELRLNNFGDENEAINLHVIFSEKLNPSTIRDNFLEELEVNFQAHTLSCKKSNLIKIGYSESEGEAFNADLDIDEFSRYESKSYYRTALGLISLSFNNIKDELFDFKKSISEWGINQDSYVFVIAAKGHGGLDSLNWTDEFVRGDNLGRAGNIRQGLLYHTDICFTNNENDKNFHLGRNPGCPVDEFKTRFGTLKPNVWGSDAHDYENLFHPSNGNSRDYTWIKADPTFEGLRQIVFEPENRVVIRAFSPNQPLIKLNRVDIELPENPYLDGQEYCLKSDYDIQFSPFFTCFIGGRGTGKSSILNLIDHFISEKKNKFFEQHDLKDSEENAVDIDNVVTLDEKSEKQDVEFLSQNEIEEFAQDESRFTDAIYRRLIKLDSENEINEISASIQLELSKLDDRIKSLKNVQSLEKKISSLKKDIKKNENILSSLEDDDYQRESKELSNKSRRLNRIKKAKEKFEKVLGSIEEVVKEIPDELDEDIVFERELKSISESLSSLKNDYNIEELSEEAEEDIQNLQNDIEDLEASINSFLEEKDLSEENLKEASAAQTTLDVLKDKVVEKDEEIADQEEFLENQVIHDSVKSDFKETVNRHLENVNEKFEEINKDRTQVKKISLEYDFDSRSAKEELKRKVQKWIEESDEIKTSSLRIDHLGSKLFLVEPENVDAQDEFLAKLESDDGITSETLYKHFEDEFNFRIYKAMIDREFLDAQRYKRINVFYDGRPIKNTSFGQRCTAAIVILLSLGNNPIIIDEPEAHLDSSLIADNLVELIKNTKSQRQIIFATHNANFVINGDAELIHVLEVNENNEMEITSTTIENLSNRSHLYALEGGEEAFKQREVRYSIS